MIIHYVEEFSDLKFTPLWDGVQAIVNFGDYELSIVKHSGSYGASNGLYEIGVTKDNEMVELPGITLADDTVKGHLTEEDVSVIIKKMYTLTGNEGVQI